MNPKWNMLQKCDFLNKHPLESEQIDIAAEIVTIYLSLLGILAETEVWFSDFLQLSGVAGPEKIRLTWNYFFTQRL